MIRWGLFAVASLAALGGARAEPDANALLFEAPYVSRLQPGTKLTYRIEQATVDPAAPGLFADSLDVTRPGADASPPGLAVVLRTGEREREIGRFPDMAGNPVIMLFLEQDVQTMSRTLKGGATYIRKRVRLALETAESEPARVTFEGRELEARRIVVTPFVQDPNGEKLREYAQKRYEFLLADAVPGGVFEIRTVTPGEKGPLAEERLIYSGSAQPAQAPRGPVR